MDEDSTRRRIRFIAITATIMVCVFAFFVLAVSIADGLFPSDITLDPVPFEGVTRAFSQLLVWAAASVATMGICALIVAYAIARLMPLTAWIRNYGLIWMGVMSLLGTIVLFLGGSEIGEKAIAHQCTLADTHQTLCDYPGEAGESPTAAANRLFDKGGAIIFEPVGESIREFFEARGWIEPQASSVDATSFARGTLVLRYLVNFFFQLAAISILSLALILASTRRIYVFVEARTVREVYLIAAGVLTLVILTDALFYDFLVAQFDQQDGAAPIPFLEYQRGMLFFHAIVSTTTLLLVLFLCSRLGRIPLSLSGREVDPEEYSKGLAGLIERSKAFFATPGFATAFATLAPVITAVLGSSASGNG